MRVKVRYLGSRAKTLGAYSDKQFIAGPYDFSNGSAEMEAEDARVLLVNNPRGFKLVSGVLLPADPEPELVTGPDEDEDPAEGSDEPSGKPPVVSSAKK